MGERVDRGLVEDFDIEVVEVNNPSLPITIGDLVSKHRPDFVFLCPGADRDFSALSEGANVEDLLFEESASEFDIPVIIVSEDHYH